MPLIKLSGNRWKFGKLGFIYSGKGAREKARKQGQAIEISKLRAKGEKVPYPKSIKVKASRRARGYERRV